MPHSIRRIARPLVASLLVLYARAAGATVTEPNGVVVPTNDTGNGEMRLDAFFAAEGEAIDWRADAFATPATFSPLCGFKATLKRVDSGSKYGVGWYNVDPNASAPPTQVFPIVPRNATPGQVFTGDDIRSAPEYAGGLIGFALIRDGVPAYHYSENAWNTLCDIGCLLTPGRWSLSLTYRSAKIPNAWYMGFEDGNATNLGWNNDGDFNDSLFLFEGLTCAGGGEPCEVPGVDGACKAGLTECEGSGTLSCKQVVQPQAETCDGIDNDCEGGIDEGDDLCDTTELCYKGRCVPNCSRGEFPCDPDEVCVSGVCVGVACASKVCDEGKACVDGECIAPCDGVVCPGDQQCLLGRCVDLCGGVTCDGGRVCERGVCVEACSCRGCTGGLVCQGGAHPAAGRCVPAGCIDRTCGAGETCTEASGGACAPLCGPNVVCPKGQGCSLGECVAVAEPDGGSSPGGSSGAGGGGVFFENGGTTGSAGGAGPGVDAGTNAGATSFAGAPGSNSGSDAKLGCGCRTQGSSGGTAGLFAGLAGLGLLAVRRRRNPRRGLAARRTTTR